MGQYGLPNFSPINGAVNFLHKNNDDVLSSIRENYPQLSQELELGLTLGDADSQLSYQQERAEIFLLALRELSERTKTAYKRVYTSLLKNKKLKLICDVLVVLGGATILTTISIDPKWPKILAALTTLFASIGSLYIEYASRLTAPELGSLEKSYTEFYSTSKKAEVLIAEIEVAQKTGLDGEELFSLLGKANALLEKGSRWPSVLLEN